MQIGNHEVKTAYRLTWTSGKQNRSRLYTQLRSAERKAEKMRADGKACEIEEWLLVRLVPAGGLPEPKGDASFDLADVEMVVWGYVNQHGPCTVGEVEVEYRSSYSAEEIRDAIAFAVSNGMNYVRAVGAPDELAMLSSPYA